MSTTQTPGSGTNNTFDITTKTCNADNIELNLNGRDWKEHWGGNGPASDNTWASTEYLIFYLTIAPDAANADLPNNEHDFIFVQGSCNYKSSSGAAWTTSTMASFDYRGLSLASSATLSTLSNNRGGPTEFSFTLSELTTRTGPLNNNYNILI